MKFVYNAEKEAKSRDILMMQPTIAEAEEMLKKDETDPYAWYVIGTALSIANRIDEAIDAHCTGISYAPFYVPNYFGRGRRHNVKGEWKQGLADFILCSQLDPQNWTYWYYRATTENIHGMIEESIDDFKECLNITRPEDQYPLGDWLYTTLCSLGRYKEAEEILNRIADDAECETMDYGYKRCVQLYKGIVKPEEFINIPLFEEKMLKRPNRVELEITGMYWGLYWFWMLKGDETKANEALMELLKHDMFPTAFAYQKGTALAKKKGLI